MILASIIIPCMGRLDHLKQTLSSAIDQVCVEEHEILVVDYGCPDKCGDWVVSNYFAQYENLRVIHATPRDGHFNLSHARNCGAVHAHGDVLGFVDADVFLTPLWLEEMARYIHEGANVVRPDIKEQGWDSKRLWWTSGTCAVLRERFIEVRGYDEAIEGWGAEDTDLYERMGDAVYYDPTLAIGIEHGDGPRTENYGTADKFESQKRNIAYVAQRNHHGRKVNPEGFGK